MKLLVASLLLVGASAVAEPRDYRLDSSAWNGLGTLAEEAEGLGCRMAASDELDWAQLGTRDVLFLIYPETPLDPGAVANYLQRGGRLLIADDFGSAGPTLAALELRRGAAHLEGVARMPHHPELPVAHARLLTVLGRSVSELVANHPAAFDTALPATYVFSPGQALVVEGQVGTGRFVALSDPSVLINNMLEVEGNRLFARALVAGLCRPGRDGDRVHVLTGMFAVRGAPTASARGSSALAKLNDVLSSLNRSVEPIAPALGLPLAILLAAGAALLSRAALRRRAPDRYDRHAEGGFVRPTRSEQLTPQTLVAGLSSRADHTVPLLLLRAEVMRTLGALLGPIPAAGGRLELLRRVEARLGPHTADSLRRLFDVGPAELDADSPSRRRVSRRAFEHALELAAPLFASTQLPHDKREPHAL